VPEAPGWLPACRAQGWSAGKNVETPDPLPWGEGVGHVPTGEGVAYRLLRPHRPALDILCQKKACAELAQRRHRGVV